MTMWEVFTSRTSWKSMPSFTFSIMIRVFLCWKWGIKHVNGNSADNILWWPEQHAHIQHSSCCPLAGCDDSQRLSLPVYLHQSGFDSVEQWVAFVLLPGNCGRGGRSVSALREFPPWKREWWQDSLFPPGLRSAADCRQPGRTTAPAASKKKSTAVPALTKAFTNVDAEKSWWQIKVCEWTCCWDSPVCTAGVATYCAMLCKLCTSLPSTAAFTYR